jgi:hypothetical protein
MTAQKSNKSRVLQFKNQKSPESMPNTMSEEQNLELSNIATEIESRLVRIKVNYYQIGELLTKARKILPHGTFQTWIQQHFNWELPYSTASLYMRIFEKFQHSRLTVQYLPLSFLLGMTEKTMPEKIKAILEENAKFLKSSDLRGFQLIYEKFKQKKSTYPNSRL